MNTHTTLSSQRRPGPTNRRAAPPAAAVLCALAAMLLMGSAPATIAGAQPGINGQIAFESDGKIYTADPDGSALHQVTTTGRNYSPSWSPDGRQIAFVRDINGSRPLGGAIWIADADGSNAHQVMPIERGHGYDQPHFTSDGTTIVFEDCLGEGCDGGISAVQTDGTAVHHITPNSGRSYNWPVPSPDATHIAFMRWHVGGATMRIYVARADGTHQHAVSPVRLQAWAPSWSPDGRTILFTSNIFGSRPQGAIYSVRTDGSALRKLTRPSFGHEDAIASYSPDGRTIILQSDRRYTDRSGLDIYTMNSDGLGLQRIPIALKHINSPRWGTAPTG